MGKKNNKKFQISKKALKRAAAHIVAFAMVAASVGVPQNSANAAAKIKLSKKSVTVKVGKKKTVKVKTSLKVTKLKAKVKKKAVASVKVKGKKIIVTGKKAGSTKVVVTVKVNQNGKIVTKKLKFKVKVKADSSTTVTQSPTTTATTSSVASTGSATSNGTNSGSSSSSSTTNNSSSSNSSSSSSSTNSDTSTSDTGSSTSDSGSSTSDSGSSTSDSGSSTSDSDSTSSDTSATADPSSTAVAEATVEPVEDYSKSGYESPGGTTIYDEDTNTTISDDAYEISIDTDAITAGTASKVTETGTDSSGNTVTVYELTKKGKLTIYQPGEYVVSTTGSGSVAKGITVDIDSSEVALVDGASDIVQIFLNGVNYEVESETASEETDDDNNTYIDYDDEGIIKVKKTTDISKVIVTAVDGTTNTLTQTGTASTDTSDDETYYPMGILSKKVPLTINGSGTINITAANGTGIKVSDYNEGLKILNTTLSIDVGHVGIQTKTLGYFGNAVLTVKAVDDGIKTTVEEADITDADDPIDVDVCKLEFQGGTYVVESEDGDGISASYTVGADTTSEASYGEIIANPYKMTITTGTNVVTTSSSSDTGSRKGIKAGKSITVADSAGTITVDTTGTDTGSGSTNQMGEASVSAYADDAFHSNGYIYINGGAINIAAADDGMHADKGLSIDAGTVIVSTAYEGLEAADLTINGGTITVTSSDDGMNAAGGSDSQSTEGGNWGRGGQGQTSSTSNYNLIINGGTIRVYAGGDGLDSNKNFYINGGDIIVYATQNNGNSALDYDGTFQINGGKIFAVSAGSGMDEGSPTGSQTYVNFSTSLSANSTVTISDNSGNTLDSYTLAYSAVKILYSSSSLTSGSSYKLTSGNSSASATAGSSSGGQGGPGQGGFGF